LLDGAQLALRARARDRDLARFVDQVIERIGIDPQHRRGAGQRRFDLDRVHGRRAHALDIRAQPVHAFFELLEEARRQLGRLERGLDAAFHQVAQLAQPDRAGHARAAFQRVQRAAQRLRNLVVAGIGLPFAQVRADLGHQLLGFLDEDRQQLLVDVVAQDALFAPPGCGRCSGGGRRPMHRQPRCFETGNERAHRISRRPFQPWRFSAADGFDHGAQAGNRHLHRIGVVSIGRVLGERRPTFECACQLGERREARGARGARQRMRRPHEVLRSFGGQLCPPVGALRFEHRDVLGGFLRIDVVETP
jgi:hypothetical protein